MSKRKNTISLSDLQTMRPKRQERDGPTPEQQAKGGYQDRFVNHVESFTRSKVFVSSHDPVERWFRAGRLSDSQMTAIEHLRRLWRLTEDARPITANYGERIGGQGCGEARALNEIEAREDLHRIQGYVPMPYFSIMENVCRHGMSAGVAGEALGFGSRSGEIRAHQIVCFVSDVVAMKERL